jgi:radical SAM-linked protein
VPQIKVKYTKGEEVKYISHRDLMRLFQRAIRRAEIPIAYSQGFNPHMKISWGQALKVGKASDGEFATLTLEDSLPPSQLLERLNQQLPKGVEILEAIML